MVACESRQSDKVCDPDASGQPAQSVQAIEQVELFGTSLGPRELALTFDDGPSARTIELSRYLASQGIAATFFINGKRVPGREAALAQVVADGHLLANHTQNHTSLPTLSAPDIVRELEDTDAILAPLVPGGRFLFRPPYGHWDSATYAAIQASPMSKYVGPIRWDIGGMMSPGSAADWDCWDDNGNGVLTTQGCADLYVTETSAVGRGIVLMHDFHEFGGPPGTPDAPGNTVDMVPLLVPRWRAAGYTFVRLDRVPQISALLPPLPGPDAGEAGPVDSGDSAIQNDSAVDASGPVVDGAPDSPPPPVTPPPPVPPDPCAPRN